MKFLSDEERVQLKAQHKKERDKRICDRIKAVLLYDKEWSFQEIAEVLLLTEEAIRHHVSEYKSSKKLKPEGGGSEEKLSAEQVQKLESHLETSKIILHFLPPYSPNLNPIERLWKWMKERTLYNTYYQEFDDFRSAVLGFFSALSTLNPDSALGQCFRSRVRDKFRPIGAPAAN